MYLGIDIGTSSVKAMLVDGRNAAFGYVVDGFDVLEELGVDDSVVSIKVIDGADRLQPHA